MPDALTQASSDSNLGLQIEYFNYFFKDMTMTGHDKLELKF